MNFDKESQSRIYFLVCECGAGGGGGGGGEVGRERRGVGREFRAIILKSDILYHPYSFKFSSRFSG